MKPVVIRLFIYLAIASIAFFFIEMHRELIIALFLTASVCDAATTWYCQKVQEAKAGNDSSRLKVERINKIMDNLWVSLAAGLALWGYFAWLTHCQGTVFIIISIAAVLSIGLTLYNHFARKQNKNIA